MDRENRHGLHLVKDLPVEKSPVSPFGELINLIEKEGKNDLEIIKMIIEARKAGKISEEQSDNLTMMSSEKSDLERQKLKKEIKIDNLTELPKYPQETLGALVEEINFPNERRETPLRSIVTVYIDLNLFKELNDKYGHDSGDKAIIAFSDRLRSVIKGGTDLIFRPHGDEFVIVFPIRNKKDISDDVLYRVFRRLQNKVNTDFSIKVKKKNNGETDFPLSASMGYAIFKKGENKSAEELLHEADMAMQENKKIFRKENDLAAR